MKKQEATDTAFRLLLEGHQEEDVREWLLENYSRRNAHHVLAAVRRKLEAVAALPTQARLGLVILSLEELYRRMLEVGDYAGALKARNELARLLDLPTLAKELNAGTPAAGKAGAETPAEAPAAQTAPDDSSEAPAKEAPIGDLLSLVRGKKG